MKKLLITTLLIFGLISMGSAIDVGLGFFYVPIDKLSFLTPKLSFGVSLDTIQLGTTTWISGDFGIFKSNSTERTIGWSFKHYLSNRMWINIGYDFNNNAIYIGIGGK